MKDNNSHIRFAIGKITPKKVGQFVTLYKRINNGPIEPYDMEDGVEFFIIRVQKDETSGHFIFPKSILYENNIVSKNGIGGKLGIRVYPPWDIKRLKNGNWNILKRV
jgi:hypothetical protein